MEQQKDRAGSMWKAGSGIRNAALAAGLALAAGAASAQDMREQARNAAVADGVSTAVGLAAGAMEVNPLGPVLAIGMKTLAFRYAESRPDTERPTIYAAVTSLWQGAAANNICVTAALLTGGTFAPACIAIGAAWAYKTWKATEHEREFWAHCGMVRVYVGQPELQCVYKAPATATAVAAAEVVLVTEVASSEVLVTEVVGNAQDAIEE
jgi:hypothetical protein